jgi:hypothetical protein
MEIYMARTKKKHMPLDIDKILELALVKVPEDKFNSKRSLVLNKLRFKMMPTDNQRVVLQYIKKQGSISRWVSLREDWRYLGGLFSRGLIEWFTPPGSDVPHIRVVAT